jgi:Acetyltransferase (GNAT) domain
MAALVMQRLELQTERLLPAIEPEADWRKRLSHGAKALVSRPFDERRVLVLGNLLTYGQHAIAVDPALSPTELWHGATEALYRLRRAEKLEGSADFQLIKDLDGGDIERANSLTDFGYRLAETEPNMLLTLNPTWKTHTDYLNDLSSKYRKNAVSRVLAPFEDTSFRIGVIANPAVIAARIHALYLQVHEAADLRPFTLPESYWAALPETFGKRLRIVGLWQHEQVIGFVAMLLDRDQTVYAYHIGFDREAAKIAPVYLRLLHAAIAEAIAMGGERISLGRTALEPKATLGAKPERTVVYARHRQPILNKLLRGVLTHIDHDQAPERNPFKQPLGATP